MTRRCTRFGALREAHAHTWLGVCVGNKTCPGGVWDKTPVEFSLIGLLVALLPIHVFWFSIILKVAYRSLTAGAPVKDSRSDDEYDSDFDEDPREGKKKQ